MNMKKVKLFGFTEQEEAQMLAAMKSSCSYMATYGDGRQPCDEGIDRSHYVQGLSDAKPLPSDDSEEEKAKNAPTSKNRRR